MANKDKVIPCWNPVALHYSKCLEVRPKEPFTEGVRFFQRAKDIWWRAHPSPTEILNVLKTLFLKQYLNWFLVIMWNTEGIRLFPWLRQFLMNCCPRRLWKAGAYALVKYSIQVSESQYSFCQLDLLTGRRGESVSLTHTTAHTLSQSGWISIKNNFYRSSTFKMQGKFKNCKVI